MNDSALARVREGALGAFPIAMGLALLAVRPQAVANPRTAPVMLTTTYAVLAAIAIASPVNAMRSRRVGLPLVTGVVAVLAARLMFSLPVPRQGGVALAGIVTAAAIAEEAFFRRLIYARLEKFGPVIAVLTAAVLFAVIHLPEYGISAMPVDCGAGLLFGWQRWASGSWSVPAATHAAANLLAVMR